MFHFNFPTKIHFAPNVREKRFICILFSDQAFTPPPLSGWAIKRTFFGFPKIYLRKLHKIIRISKIFIVNRILQLEDDIRTG